MKVKNKYISLSLSLVLLLVLAGIGCFYEYKRLVEPGQIEFYNSRQEPILTNEGVKEQEINNEIIEFLSIDEHIVKKYVSLFNEKESIRSLIDELLLQSRLTNKDIALLYVNQLYFGDGVIGLQNAAFMYLNKEVHHLSLSEYLILQELSRREYTTITELEDSVTEYGQELVNNGKITKDIYTDFVKQAPSIIKEMNETANSSLYFLDYVLDEVMEQLDSTENSVVRKPLKVYTTLDSTIQTSMTNAVTEQDNFPQESGGEIEAGMVLLHHETGKIAGIVGGRVNHLVGLNRGTEITRQPGSAFKPLIVYAPAVELGWNKDDILQDKKMKYGRFQPLNADYKFRGTVSMEEALIYSYNAPAVWLLNEISLHAGLQELNKYGLFTVNQREGLELALGFTDIGTSPLAMAQAFTVFAQSGNMVTGSALNKITDSKGVLLYTSDSSVKKILKAETAESMLEMLEKVVNEGTGQAAKVEGETIAGKTGTTSYDGWFVGITDEYVGAVWVGDEKLEKENQFDVSGGTYPARIFSDVIKAINE